MNIKNLNTLHGCYEGNMHRDGYQKGGEGMAGGATPPLNQTSGLTPPLSQSSGVTPLQGTGASGGGKGNGMSPGTSSTGESPLGESSLGVAPKPTEGYTAGGQLPNITHNPTDPMATTGATGGAK